MTGVGLDFKWKGQKVKGLLPACLLELGSSTNVLGDPLELAQQGVAGNTHAHNSLTWRSRKKTLSKKYHLRPVPPPSAASLCLGLGLSQPS